MLCFLDCEEILILGFECLNKFISLQHDFEFFIVLLNFMVAIFVFSIILVILFG